MVRDERGLFVIPLERIPYVIYAHRHALEETGISPPGVGWTWDDYVDLARALTHAAADRYGVSLMTPGLYALLPFLQQKYDPVTSPYEHLRPGLQMIYNLLHVHGTHVPITVSSWPPRHHLQEQFLQARAATTIGDSSLVQAVYRNQESAAAGSFFHDPEIRLPERDWIILPLPVPYAGDPVVSIGRFGYALAWP